MGSIGRSWRSGRVVMTDLETMVEEHHWDDDAHRAMGFVLGYVAALTPFEREELCYFIRTNDE